MEMSSWQTTFEVTQVKKVGWEHVTCLTFLERQWRPTCSTRPTKGSLLPCSSTSWRDTVTFQNMKANLLETAWEVSHIWAAHLLSMSRMISCPNRCSMVEPESGSAILTWSTMNLSPRWLQQYGNVRGILFSINVWGLKCRLRILVTGKHQPQWLNPCSHPAW